MAEKTDTPAKKLRSKWFRVAVEGGTTDGRTIERSWIEEMAAQYSPNTYGARINCEHIKWAWPGGEFGAYGDVLACKAEEVEINGETKLALFAQLQPNDALLALNAKNQKIYTSVEIDPKFAKTGKAYLVGLAITDTPASLGTEALQFSAQHGTLTGRKQNKDNLFTAAEEVQLEFEEVADGPSMFAALRDKVGSLLSKSKEKEGRDATNFAALGELIEQLATHGAEQAEAVTKSLAAFAELEAKFAKLSSDHEALVTRLGSTQDHTQKDRPSVPGGSGRELTDC
ncbi:GPO family capsid scaffolding protein [Pseudomonas monteilii]|uniref:GPO family capsid scaffolding protein n=1 Tax=Pseudomonas monteilii TaxID=76759 RepID=UPI001E562706|nr:GPO family capsid scaffolding protein [Pseudomonas monteilii]MCE0875978.1 GPO family capsid scaffolding protein [Pseudomonas monteilii]MCE0930649.1 GPO family capsid scaffolding protein [Pseudomonas monteilii]MCE0977339.1 GPO family capsid scaffolding protein [Pseudomonas monteilii]MCE1010826.1 GPO family capsid scaffolding protein [Pseudomonas monteilii]MCE1039549.1 GPO family capsid scaffolding protein [Pseudomonas monteilii]